MKKIVLLKAICLALVLCMILPAIVACDTGNRGEDNTIEKSTTEEVTTEKPTTEKPTTEEPTSEEPTTEEPTTEEPTTEEPTTEEPTTEEPTTEEPTTEEPTTEEPTTEEPTTEEPTTEEPTTEEPTTEESTSCEHEWKDATCIKAKTCVNCGTIDGSPLGHTEVIDAAVAPTCTETGLTEGKHCSVCNAIIMAQDVVPTLAHTYITTIIEATSSASGYTENFCTVCKSIEYTDIIQSADISNSTGCIGNSLTLGGLHGLIVQNGSLSNDVYVYSDNSYDYSATYTYSAYAYSDGSIVLEETVYQNGTKTLKFTLTMNSASGKYPWKIRDTQRGLEMSGTVDAASFTTTQVYMSYSSCSSLLNQSSAEAARSAFNKLAVACLQMMLSETRTFMQSGNLYMSDIGFDNFGKRVQTHNYILSDYVPATCTSEGYLKFSCNCGSTVTETVIKEHSWNFKETLLESTCVDCGKDLYGCIWCELEELRETSANGHQDGDWVVVEEATCTQKGLKCIYCTVCNAEVNSEKTEILPHNYAEIVGKVGYITYECNDCNKIQTEVIIYSISYDLNGGEYIKNPIEYSVETYSFTLNKPSRVGYTFAGWSGTEIDGISEIVTVLAGSYGERSYKANWIANEYTVTYDPTGGIVEKESDIATYDEYFVLRSASRIGYVFDGWYYDETPIADGDWLILENITVVAKWKPRTDIPYVVNHYQQNANDDEYTLVLTENLMGTADATISPDVKTFDHFVSPTAKTVIIAPDGTLVVNYYYDRATYDLIYVTNGGESIEKQTYRYEQSLVIATPTREGYTFGGWFADKTLSRSYSDTATLSKDTSIYAYWSEENKPTDFMFSGTDAITIEMYIGTSSTMWIPAYIGGVPVKTIPASAFKDESTLVKVVVPDTVSKIGKGAFKGCNSIEDITLPFVGQSVEAQYYDAVFGYIWGYKTDHGEYSDGHTKEYINKQYGSFDDAIWQYTCVDYYGIGYGGFHYYYPNSYYYFIPTTIKNVTITSQSKISAAAFNNCDFIETIRFDKTVTTIGDCAFQNCTSLTTVYYAGTVEDWYSMNRGIENDALINAKVEYIGNPEE